jgi:hypothetical protein
MSKSHFYMGHVFACLTPLIMIPPSAAFLERPTVEGLEAFVEKKTEWNEMMAEMIGYYRTATQEQHGQIQSLKRAAERAEECRLQEYQRALERMDPAEAEAAQQAERERAWRLEKEREVRAAELNAGLAHARARAREEFMEDNRQVYNRS